MAEGEGVAVKITELGAVSGSSLWRKRRNLRRALYQQLLRLRGPKGDSEYFPCLFDSHWMHDARFVGGS